LRAVAAGAAFVVTRGGVPTAELRPLTRVAGLDTAAAVAGAARLPRLDAARFRGDVDAALDQTLEGWNPGGSARGSAARERATRAGFASPQLPGSGQATLLASGSCRPAPSSSTPGTRTPSGMRSRACATRSATTPPTPTCA